MVEIIAIASNVNHEIDRTRAANNFALRTQDFSSIEMRFWFRPVSPINVSA